MAFNFTWNSTFETQPADSEALSLGAGRIRDLKAAVSERIEIDHNWNGGVDDGEHKKITFGAPISNPSNVANKGFLYIKDVSAKVELHWIDEDGNVLPLTSAGKLLATLLDVNALAAEAAIISGDFLPFYDTSASAMKKVDFNNLGGLPRGYIDGLVLSNGTDADHDVDIAAGEARDGGDTADMPNSATLVKQLDAPWAVGTNQGGNDQAQLDGAQTVTFNDNGGSPDDVTIDAGAWTVTPVAGDTLVVIGGTNAGSFQITGTPTTTVIQVATGSFTADATSASVIHTVKINTWYHVWGIRRSDTGVTDVLFSESATAPTLPTNYDQKRRIGAVLTDAAANILGFSQKDDEFLWDTVTADFSVLNPGATAVLRTVTVPTGIQPHAIVMIAIRDANLAAVTLGIMTSPDQTDVAPSTTVHTIEVSEGSAGAIAEAQAQLIIRTNTSAQIRTRLSRSDAGIRILGVIFGWIDPRGRNA